MGRIQSDIGLVTGIPIQQTVEKLMQLAARPRDLLQQRTDALKQEQVAVTGLSALLYAVKYVTENLGKADVFDSQVATSSDPNALTATVTGDPVQGSYQVTPLRMSQTQQWLSANFASTTDPLGAGKLSFRFGSYVERPLRLELLGGGAGFTRGLIRITDRSGARADIDLSTAQTIDDVLEGISANTTINVAAVAQGDHIQLTDRTGQTVSNLRVQEVGSGQTAASLGLAGIDVAAATADGQDVLRLYDDLDLGALNDGNGVFLSTTLPDIHYHLRDGTEGDIDFSAIQPGTSQVDEDKTLGDVLRVFSAANPSKLKIEIAPDGDHLVVTDLTQGPSAFQLSSLYDSQALKGLGLDGPSSAGVIQGRRILGGLKTVLLSSLNGGQGLGTLGALALTDRSGAQATVDLSHAETLGDVLGAINAAGLGIRADVNQARNGIELVDTTGQTVSHLIVADAGQTVTAAKLGIAVDGDVTAVNSGDLHLEVIAHNTRLADFSGGAGVARGSFTITDTAGHRASVNLSHDDIETVGDLIQSINRLGIGVQAEVNDTGDGIRLVDTAHGSGTLSVTEGSTTTARDLHLLGAAQDVQIGGVATKVIDGSTTYTVDLAAEDSLEALAEKINDLAAGVTAQIISDGSSRPHRLALVSNRPGTLGALVVDASQAGFSMDESVRAQDALVQVGGGSATAGVLASSSSNVFENVLPGVRLALKQATGRPVSVSIDASDANVVANVKTMVDNYNKFRQQLADLSAYDPAADKRSVLTGDAAALRLDTDFSQLLSGRFAGAGPLQSLAEVGVTLKNDGHLSFDETKLKAAFAADPEAVKRLFTDADNGVSAKFGKLIEQTAGEDVSLLANRSTTLGDTIQRNEQRIEDMNKQLEAQTNRLYTQYYNAEIAIAKLQENLQALNALQILAPLTSTANTTTSTSNTLFG